MDVQDYANALSLLEDDKLGVLNNDNVYCHIDAVTYKAIKYALEDKISGANAKSDFEEFMSPFMEKALGEVKKIIKEK